MNPWRLEVELDCAQINVYDTMEHINSCLEQFVVEEEEEDADEALVQAVLAADSNEADEDESEE